MVAYQEFTYLSSLGSKISQLRKKGAIFMAKNPYRRTRSFKQIVYPESAPVGWIDNIQGGIDKGIIKWALISPLHNLDRYTGLEETEAAAILAGTVNIEVVSDETARLMQEITVGMSVRAGELKKEHHHLEYETCNPKRNHEANKYFKGLTNGTNVIARDNLRGSVRYLAHLDEDPNEKAFYDPSEIIVLGDINIDRYLTDEDASMSTLMAWYAIEDLINEHNVTNMCQFDKFMRKQDVDLQNIVMSNQNLRNRVRDHVRDKRTYVERDLESEILKNKRFQMREANLTRREIEFSRQKDLHDTRVKSDLVLMDMQRAYIEDVEAHIKSTSA